MMNTRGVKSGPELVSVPCRDTSWLTLAEKAVEFVDFWLQTTRNGF